MRYATFVALIAVLAVVSAQVTLPIGSIVSSSESSSLYVQTAIRVAVDRVNANSRYSPRFRFSLIEANVTNAPISTQVDQTVRLVNSGVVGVVGPSSFDSLDFIEPISTKAKIPFLAYSNPLDDLSKRAAHPFVLRVNPSFSQYSAALTTLISNYNWKRMTVIYSDDSYGQASVQPFLSTAIVKSWRVIEAIPYAANDTNSAALLRDRLRNSRRLDCNIIVMDVIPGTEDAVWEAAEASQLWNRDILWILLPRMAMVPVKSFAANRIAQMPGSLGLRARAVGDMAAFRTALLAKNSAALSPVIDARDAGVIPVEAAMAHDAVLLLAESINSLMLSGVNVVRPVAPNLSSLSSITASSFGTQLVNQLLTISLSASSFAVFSNNPFALDANGNAKDPNFEVVNVPATATQGWVRVALVNTTSITFTGQSIYWPAGRTATPTDRAISRPLVFGVPVNPPFQTYNPNVAGNAAWDGMVVQIFKKAMEFYPDQPYTLVQWNGTYNGLIDAVDANTFDGGIGDIAITNSRMQKVDFAQPYLTTGFVLIVPGSKTGSTTPWDFLKPLSWSVWVPWMCFLVWGGIVMWFLERPLPEKKKDEDDCDEPFSSPDDKKYLPSFTSFVKSMHFGFSTLFFTHKPDAVRTPLSRLFVNIWCAAVLILLASYTANLVSFLTVAASVQSFTSIEDAATKNAQIGFYDGGPGADVLTENGVSPGNIVYGLKGNADYLAAFSAGSVEVVLEGYIYAQLFTSVYCEYTTVGREITPQRWGFPLPSDSTLGGILSPAIIRLQETGVLDQLREKYIIADSKCADRQASSSDDESVPQLDFVSFTGLFAIAYVTGGVVLIAHLVSKFLLGGNKPSKGDDHTPGAEMVRVENSPTTPAPAAAPSSGVIANPSHVTPISLDDEKKNAAE